MRTNRLPAAVQVSQIVFLNAANAGEPVERERLGLRTCLAAWGGLAVVSWAAVLVVGSRLI